MAVPGVVMGTGGPRARRGGRPAQHHQRDSGELLKAMMLRLGPERGVELHSHQFSTKCTLSFDIIRNCAFLG